MQVWLSKYHWLPLTIAGVLQIVHRRCGGADRHRIQVWRHRHASVGHVPAHNPRSARNVACKLRARISGATRRFETKDDSRNSWWVALLTGGEGWHNNHHAHPVSARHGLAWYEFDINYYGIWVLEKLGLAKKVQIAKWDPSNPKPAGA